MIKTTNMWKPLMTLAIFCSMAVVSKASDQLELHTSIFLGEGSSSWPAKVNTTWGSLRAFLVANPNAAIKDLEVEFTCQGARYTAIFSDRLGPQEIRVGLDVNQFNQDLMAASAVGLILTDVDVQRDPDGVLRYTSVWSAGTGQIQQFADSMTLADLDFENLTWQRQGYQMVDLETYDTGDGTPLYAALWEFGAESTLYYANLDWSTFHQHYHDLGDLNYRLVDLEQQPDGKFAGVWKASTAPDFMVVGFGTVGEDELLGGGDCGMLTSDQMVDYEKIVVDDDAVSVHQQKQPECGHASDLLPFNNAPAHMTNHLPLHFQANVGDHHNTNLAALHHGGSTGPGN